MWFRFSTNVRIYQYSANRFVQRKKGIDLKKNIKSILIATLSAFVFFSTPASAFAEISNGDELNGMIYYAQGDYRNVPFNGSNVSSSGCGITAFAMVASVFGKDITPEDVATLANENKNTFNTVSNHEAIRNLADYYDMPEPEEMGGVLMNCCRKNDYDEDYLREELENGSIVIVSQTGGYFNPSYRGHYIVLYGIGENGPYVYDPGSKARTEEIFDNDGYDWENLFSKSKHIWIFTDNRRINKNIKQAKKN